MDPQYPSPPFEKKNESDHQISRLDHEETQLWRLSLSFIALLAVGLAAATWDNLSQLSIHFGIIPCAAALFAFGLAYQAGKKRRAIIDLRSQLVASQKSAPEPDDGIEQLVDIIRRSQRGFRELVDSFDDVVLAVSMDGVIQASNRTFSDIIGENFSSFVYHPISDFIEKPTATEVQRTLPRLLDRHQWSGVVEVQFRNEAKPRFFDSSMRTIEKDGHATGISIWGRDVTQQRERESRFSELFETLHEGAYFCTPEGRLLDGNQSLINLLGFENRTALLSGRLPDLYVDSADWTQSSFLLNEKASLEDREIRLRRRDGVEVVCLNSCRAVFDSEGRVSRYQGTLVDITRRRQREADQNDQQQFHRRLIECFPDAILVVDRNLHYTFVSPRMRDVLGWEPDDVIGKPVPSSSENAEPARLYRDVLSGAEKIGSIEFSAQNRSGSWRTLRATASPLLGPHNEIVGAVASVRDVTMTKQVEQQLVQAERLAAMGQMIDGFAHELNNPLTAIMGAIDLLDISEQEGPKKHMRLLKEQARRAVEIVQNLLFFSRPPARGTSRLNLNDLIQRTLMLHQYSLRVNSISVDFLPEPSLPLYEGDANQLMQVLLNLLINAEQAIRSVRERGSIRVRLGRGEGKIWVSFQDDGPGVPEGMLRNIFDPFYSTKRPSGGTGMGLSVALGIVKNYGGDIDFQPAPGSGAVFTVNLPTRAPTPTELAAIASSN